MISTINDIMFNILDWFVRLGKILNRIFNLDIPYTTPEELLYSTKGMAMVIGFISILPVIFILDALIQHLKRKHAGVIMKNKRTVSGVVMDIHWKKMGNGAYSKITGDRFATVNYIVKGEKYILRCPAGGILKGDKVQIVYEEEKPDNAMLERDYNEGQKGHIREKIMAALGILVILISIAMTIVARIA